jgi:hypothetical protein
VAKKHGEIIKEGKREKTETERTKRIKKEETK